jgi:hypothetical protein
LALNREKREILKLSKIINRFICMSVWWDGFLFFLQ